MVDYEKWPLKRMSVTSILLDPDNPRIPTSADKEQLGQRQLIAELIEHDNVYELAKGIADNGYFPNEVIITFVDKADSKRYVVEGNRRVAALKCLLSPDAAPEEFRAKFEKLSAHIDSKTLSKIFVLTAPNRKAAIPLLLDRHTHQQIQSWSRPMQAQFLRRLQDQGMSAEQIAAWSGKTTADVRKLIAADVLYSAACNIELDNAVKTKVANPRSFPLSTLERVFDAKGVTRFLGVERDDEKVFKGSVKQAEFEKGFKKIVTDVAKGAINTRKLNSSDDIRKYLATFGDAKPDLSKIGRFDITKLADKKSRGLQETKKSKPPKRKTSRPSTSVIPAVFKCSCASKRINDVFKELRALNVNKFPNSSALLLRTLIDMCVSNYLDKTGEMKDLLKKHQNKGKKKEWAPSLHQMLHHLLHEVDCGLEGAAHTALQTFNTSRKSTYCLDGLDKFVHNQYLPPEPAELRNIWTIVEPLMEIVLVDPE